MMIWDEWAQRRHAAEFAPRSSHLAVVLSLVSSLAIVAITSKNHIVTSVWIHVAAFAIPIPIALYFDTQIRLRIVTYFAAIVVLFGAAVLFGT